MPSLLSARFHTTVAQSRQLPREGLPEVAVVGRSNSGKSSVINLLCNRRRLAFSSSTPGRTQALNFFALGPPDTAQAYLVDTPGYGYAVAPQELRGGWDALAGHYLRDRAELRAVVLTVDIRRSLTALDRRMLEWLAPELPLLVLLTKADKLVSSKRQTVVRETAAALAELRAHDTSLIAFSTLKKIGVDEATRWIERQLG
ncbi:MAG: ribosome biogenesis GTP-binding protein YihA/YsxC [Burkholderiaceae bacterium]|nr:ribosome biogenesis GTP-binding protein YihA/YsxC [Burkholderiaceae bacterium]